MGLDEAWIATVIGLAFPRILLGGVCWPGSFLRRLHKTSGSFWPYIM